LLCVRTYAGQVTGLVLIDAVTPQMMTTLGAQWPEYQRVAVHLHNVVPGYQSEQYTRRPASSKSTRPRPCAPCR
jgi:hypothetical protein